jgi:hypothetical protein
MSNHKAILTIGGKDHRLPMSHGCYVATADTCNALRDSGDPWFTCVVGGFSFLGEGSGPYLMGDDMDPERRAEVTGELLIAGQFATLEEAEQAGEEAVSTRGYCGVYGDSYIIPEAAGMRVINEGN